MEIDDEEPELVDADVLLNRLNSRHIRVYCPTDRDAPTPEPELATADELLARIRNAQPALLEFFKNYI